MTATVLVTRPQPDNETTCEALRAQGVDVLAAPMLRFQSVAFVDDRDADYGGVIVTSANALRDFLPPPALLALPLFAVGARTAETARNAGFTKVLSADGDAASVRALIASKLKSRMLKKGGTLLYLAGADLSRDLAGELGELGFSVVTQTTYRMTPVTALPANVQQALVAGEVKAVLHYSRRSARAFLEAARHDGVEIAALAARHVCISDAVAAIVRDAGAGQVAIAGTPDEAALFDALDRTMSLPAR